MKILSKKKMLKRAGFFGRLAPQRKKSDKGSTGSTSHPLDRIYREINVLKKLSHPNIVKLVEVLDDPVQDNLYLGNSIGKHLKLSVNYNYLIHLEKLQLLNYLIWEQLCRVSRTVIRWKKIKPGYTFVICC